MLRKHYCGGMWGGTLFFVTIVLVVPSARAILEEYAALTIARLAAQSPLTEIILASIVVIAAMLLLILRESSPQPPAVYRVRREMRGLSMADLESSASRSHGKECAGGRRYTAHAQRHRQVADWCPRGDPDVDLI